MKPEAPVVEAEPAEEALPEVTVEVTEAQEEVKAAGEEKQDEAAK